MKTRHDAQLPGGLRRLIDAWYPLDPRAVAEQFSEDGVYRASPFVEAAHGPTAIGRRLDDTRSDQRDARTWFGRPMWSGAWVTLECWTSVEYCGVPCTFAGVLLAGLTPDGRCRELREYATPERHRLVPYSGWARPID